MVNTYVYIHKEKGRVQKKKKKERNKIRRRNNGGGSCAHCVLSLSLSLICSAVTAAICTWSSVHGRHCTYAHAKKNGERKKKKREKNERKKDGR
jgi:hypothetical protein